MRGKMQNGKVMTEEIKRGGEWGECRGQSEVKMDTGVVFLRSLSRVAPWRNKLREGCICLGPEFKRHHSSDWLSPTLKSLGHWPCLYTRTSLDEHNPITEQSPIRGQVAPLPSSLQRVLKRQGYLRWTTGCGRDVGGAWYYWRRRKERWIWPEDQRDEKGEGDENTAGEVQMQ